MNLLRQKSQTAESVLTQPNLTTEKRFPPIQWQNAHDNKISDNILGVVYNLENGMKKTLGRFSCATFLVAAQYITELKQQDGKGKKTASLVWQIKVDNNFVWKNFPPNFNFL